MVHPIGCQGNLTPAPGKPEVENRSVLTGVDGADDLGPEWGRREPFGFAQGELRDSHNPQRPSRDWLSTGLMEAKHGIDFDTSPANHRLLDRQPAVMESNSSNRDQESPSDGVSNAGVGSCSPKKILK